ncbi:uncharacterized protein LOC120672463 [Panicum virgatum]|uniref:uncharacterized protein LOC120672463 n=1 Tax=Panicum virgatum TaxID=38727 RepID=UPI0019D5F92D|nr:uncharacterized protein LOC120672463 [Panicum virgatum]
MWIVRHPQPPQGQAPRPVSAYWNNPGVTAKGPCFNCGGLGHISRDCPSPRRGGAFNAPRPNAPPPQASRQEAKPQQAPKRGRLNYTTAEEIPENAEVLMVTGPSESEPGEPVESVEPELGVPFVVEPEVNPGKQLSIFLAPI